MGPSSNVRSATDWRAGLRGIRTIDLQRLDVVETACCAPTGIQSKRASGRAQRRPFASPETGEKGSRRSVSISAAPGEGHRSSASGIEADWRRRARLRSREPGPGRETPN
jgi:hypothetical protein